MKKNQTIAFLICVLFAAVGCKENPYKAEILGSWSVDLWILEKSAQEVFNTMDFTFHEDDTYHVNYGTETESGKYWFVDDKLFTQETGNKQKSVKLMRLENDTMIIQMNRAGDLERVFLLKNK